MTWELLFERRDQWIGRYWTNRWVCVRPREHHQCAVDGPCALVREHHEYLALVPMLVLHLVWRGRR